MPRRFSRLKPTWLSLVAGAAVLSSLTGWAAEVPGKAPTDAMLPGKGPAQKGDWFDRVWTERRAEFRKTAAADQGAVVFLGDSITQGWSDLAAQFPKYHCANRGISGDTTRGVLFRLRGDVLELKPAAVVLLIGTNDLGLGATPEETAENVRAILAALKAANPTTLVIVCKVMPSSASKQRPADKIQKLNALVDELVKADVHCVRCDTYSIFANEHGDAKPEEFPDLLHPNASGYAKWAAAVRPMLGMIKPVDAPVVPAGANQR